MKKILIVDDEGSTLELVAATFRHEPGYQLLEARDGEEALDVARAEGPELVLLDVLLPGLTGLDVCRLIKSDPRTKDAVVIMLTALASKAHAQAARNAGADDYVTKPFSPIALFEKVKKALNSH